MSIVGMERTGNAPNAKLTTALVQVSNSIAVQAVKKTIATIALTKYKKLNLRWTKNYCL
jgi:hypothetical protein